MSTPNMLSKRWLINYLLLVLIIIFTWIGLKYPIREDQLINRNAITTLKPQNIKRLKIETADETIRLEKQGSSWKITDPINWLANNISAERLTTLASLDPQSKLPREQIDLSSLGLRIPKAVVTLNQQSIYFGDTNQIGNRRYLLVESNVYLASDIHFAFIALGLPGLLDNRLVPASLNLQSLKFSEFLLAKKQGRWTADPPQHESLKIDQLISNWQTKQASRIKPYDTTLSPLQKIAATLENNISIEFYVLSIQPEIIIARPDLKLQYHFPDHQYYELLSLDKPGE